MLKHSLCHGAGRASERAGEHQHEKKFTRDRVVPTISASAS